MHLPGEGPLPQDRQVLPGHQPLVLVPDAAGEERRPRQHGAELRQWPGYGRGRAGGSPRRGSSDLHGRRPRADDGPGPHGLRGEGLLRGHPGPRRPHGLRPAARAAGGREPVRAEGGGRASGVAGPGRQDRVWRVQRLQGDQHVERSRRRRGPGQRDQPGGLPRGHAELRARHLGQGRQGRRDARLRAAAAVHERAAAAEGVPGAGEHLALFNVLQLGWQRGASPRHQGHGELARRHRQGPLGPGLPGLLGRQEQHGRGRPLLLAREPVREPGDPLRRRARLGHDDDGRPPRPRRGAAGDHLRRVGPLPPELHCPPGG
mmetsp:Transcript_65858/g.183666  ORF Transcript_65858/g.183666 Transcript_65858/m.183666 type:complete len:318 (+) Transcript_65858:333-1286(+)